jgi:hypothetical protein
MDSKKGSTMFNINPDLMALAFVVAPATIGGVIAVLQSKYSRETDQPARQEPTFSLTSPVFEKGYPSYEAVNRREPTFEKV